MQLNSCIRALEQLAAKENEPDQRRLTPELLAAELADVQLIACDAHIGMAGITDMSVVRPDDRLGIRAFGVEQVLERLEHVRVAQVPAFRAAIIHDAVIALGRRDQPRVLRRIKEGIAIAFRIVEPLAQ